MVADLEHRTRLGVIRVCKYSTSSNNSDNVSDSGSYYGVVVEKLRTWSSNSQQHPVEIAKQ
jgi:hypothetical protein